MTWVILRVIRNTYYMYNGCISTITQNEHLFKTQNWQDLKGERFQYVFIFPLLIDPLFQWPTMRPQADLSFSATFVAGGKKKTSNGGLPNNEAHKSESVSRDHCMNLYKINHVFRRDFLYTNNCSSTKIYSKLLQRSPRSYLGGDFYSINFSSWNPRKIAPLDRSY